MFFSMLSGTHVEKHISTVLKIEFVNTPPCVGLLWLMLGSVHTYVAHDDMYMYSIYT